MFHPAFPEYFLRIEDDNVGITLIVTKRIYKRLENDFEEELKLYLTRKNRQLFCLCRRNENSYADKN
ncbi:transcriptional regulator FilR1 domain-containing protein [Methanosarcina horonobensis]